MTSDSETDTETGLDDQSPDGADPEKAKASRQALQAKMLTAGFGEIVSVLMRSPHYKHYSLTDLEWLVVPPLLANQFTLAEARTKDGAIPAPIGVALWAFVSPEVDEKLSQNLDRPMRLRPDEWKSGDIPWLIDAIGPPDVVKAMLQRLGQAVFKGTPYKIRARDSEGKVAIRTVETKVEESGEKPSP